jgi:uncharacterized peroxidase-related enzyme
MSHIRGGGIDEATFPPFESIRQTFGFLPNFFRAQTLRPDLIEAEVNLIGGAPVREGALERRQKEYVFLVCSAANMSTYCVTAHCEIVRMLHIGGPEPEQIAIDHLHADIPIADKALLNFALKLNSRARKIDADNIEGLRTYGFSDQQILEAILMVGIAQFANVVAYGLGTVPDFDAAKVESALSRVEPGSGSAAVSLSAGGASPTDPRRRAPSP